MSDIVIRVMTPEDVPDVVRLQRDCFPYPFPEELLWRPEHLEHHLTLFPSGQFVVEIDGQVIGSCSNCIVSESKWRAHGNWDSTVGGPMLTHHDPNGTTLYGVDVSVHPRWRGKGAMKALYGCRFDLVSSSSLIRYGTAVRIPGYRDYAIAKPGATPEDYVQAVASGSVSDQTLTPMLRVGLSLEGVIRNYMQDEESHNAAAVLEWKP